MGHGNHHVGAVFLEPGGLFVGSLYAVYVFETGVVRLGHNSRRIKIDADEAHGLVADLFHHRGHKKAFERRFAEVIVGAEAHGVELFPLLGELLHAFVKLVVAENLYVIAHSVHHLAFHLASEERIVERPLHGIACINEHDVFISAAHTVDQHIAPRHAAEVVAVRVNGRVSVVCVEDHKPVGRFVFLRAAASGEESR